MDAMEAGDKNLAQRLAARAASYTYSYQWFFCFCLAYVSSFFLSGVYAPSLHVDPSWNVILEYAAAHNFQFGRDIVFTYGPLGFLNTSFSQGLLVPQRILIAIAWGVIVAWSATGLARQIPGMMKFAFLIWFLVFFPGTIDQPPFLVMAYCCMILTGDVDKQKGAAATFLIVLALLSLIKFTFFMAATVGIAICIILQICKRNVKTAAIIAMFFGTIFLALWLATGQQLVNLGPWIKGSLEISSGYTEAMSVLPKMNVLVACAAAGALFLVALLVIARTAQLSMSLVGTLLTTTLFVFLTWKLSFVRADVWHVYNYIFFLPAAFAFLLTGTMQNSMSGTARRTVATLYLGVIILSALAAEFQEPGIIRAKFMNWPGVVWKNANMILKLRTGDWQSFFAAMQSKPQMTPDSDLPIAREIIGKAPVDVLNYMQAAVFANNLTYHPRPVVQGYSAFTPYLQNLNLSFLRSEQRPPYLLFKMETIDGRFPTLDDATGLLYILNNYLPAARAGNFLVMNRTAGKPADVSMKLVHEQTLRFGERLDLKPWNGKPLVMQVTMQPTLPGRAVKFFYQAPELFLIAYKGIQGKRYRFIPAMAESGFLVSPLLETNEQVLELLAQEPGSRPDSILFSRPGSAYSRSQLSNDISVRLYRVNGFPAVPPGKARLDDLARLRGPVFDPAPLSIAVAIPAGAVDLQGAPALWAHAPSRVVLPVPAGVREFSGSMGMLEGAYSGEGGTDGVTFVIDAEGEGGKQRRLLTRLVQPKEHAADRGRLPFTVPVDSLRDRRLILTVGVGPNNDMRWDWSVWSKCRFK